MNDKPNLHDFETLLDIEDDLSGRSVTRSDRRKRKTKVHHTAKVSEDEILASIAETTLLERGFNTTYTPARHETGWLLSALQPFFDQELIDDVLYLVKGGKEANVYCCSATAATGHQLLAAKVYRPRIFRALRNDAEYRSGRTLLDGSGSEILDGRTKRAVNKKSAYGASVRHTSWLMYEYEALHAMYDADAPVPEPISMSDNAVLMGYVGDRDAAAPMLSSVRLNRDEAEPLCDQMVAAIDQMLQMGWVHGDFSAYNILYWDGALTIIDFPQLIAADGNPDARRLLQRDIDRICEYFQRCGVTVDSQAIGRKLWHAFRQSTASRSDK